MAAGSATVTESTCYPVKKIQWTWTAGTGAAEGTCTKATTESYYGQVIALVTDPDGTDAPSDNYTITITDADSYDVMQAATTANRSTSSTQSTVPTATSVAFGTLTLNVSSAGSGKKGVATLYIAEL